MKKVGLDTKIKRLFFFLSKKKHQLRMRKKQKKTLSKRKRIQILKKLCLQNMKTLRDFDINDPEIEDECLFYKYDGQRNSDEQYSMNDYTIEDFHMLKGETKKNRENSKRKKIKTKINYTKNCLIEKNRGICSKCGPNPSHSRTTSKLCPEYNKNLHANNQSLIDLESTPSSSSHTPSTKRTFNEPFESISKKQCLGRNIIHEFFLFLFVKFFNFLIRKYNSDTKNHTDT